MEDDKKMEGCGCDCDKCMKGDHEHCETGMCQQKMPKEDEEEK